MDKKMYNRIWALIMILTLVAITSISLFFVPYNISKDQHMVDTINERAWEYEHPEGVVTDFTEAEIMSLDAQEEYENKVWKLNNQELYWVEGLAFGLIISGLIIILLLVMKGYISDYYDYF